MQPLLTAPETQALDRGAAERGITVETLMERAGHAVARAAVVVGGGAYGRRAVVVSGKGNNGGDGLVAARYLARWGAGVDVFSLSDPASGPSLHMVERLRGSGVTPRAFRLEGLRRALDRADVAVDAIFGTGFRGAVEGPHAEAIRAIEGSGRPVVAVDIPSGVEGDTGAVRGPAVEAEVTVTFGAPKIGTVLLPGAAHAGVVEVADIGFPPDLVRGDALLVEPQDVASLLPPRPLETHKRATGVVLVVAGSRTMTGAPLLVAEGAYRTGAGLITVAVPEGVLSVVQRGITEATFLPLPESGTGAVTEGAWDVVADRLDGFDAVALGPGLSTDEGVAPFVRRLVAECPVPLVVDADAINAFAGAVGDLAARASDAVVTPHAGEFGRLVGMPASEVVEDRIGFTRKAAAEARAVVLLKGSRTVIASPEGEVRVNATGTPVLATGGTGDVLTGAVAACLARGLPALDAATAAAYVHGLAGQIAGADLGEGTMASDVARAIPAALRRIREGR
jgi:ADP-dependent NAD(P)H-hydrate dehydratase / NAD(P)H-hydrate epimerase